MQRQRRQQTAAFAADNSIVGGARKSIRFAKPLRQPDVCHHTAAADAAAVEKKAKLKTVSASEGSSILTSGAGILDETDLRKNTLGAGAYNRNTSSGLG